MLVKAQEHGLLTVALPHGLYEVSSPPVGLRSAKLPTLAPDATGVIKATSASTLTPGGLPSELPSSATGVGKAPTAALSGQEQLPVTVVISEAELRKAVTALEVLEPDLLE